jgi:ribosome maturation factor RimP
MNQIDSQVHQQIREVAEAIAGRLGCELVSVVIKKGSRGSLVRVFVDTPSGITVAACAAFSKELSAVLDEKNPIEGAYTLEVSSPGIERKLHSEKDFVRNAGKEIRLVLHEIYKGTNVYNGKLLACNKGTLLIETAPGERCEIPFSKVSYGKIDPEN